MSGHSLTKDDIEKARKKGERKKKHQLENTGLIQFIPIPTAVKEKHIKRAGDRAVLKRAVKSMKTKR